MVKYLKLWWKMTLVLFQVQFANRMGAVLFTLGKIIRFVTFILFLFLLLGRTNELAGYTFWEVVLFFVTFNIIDTLSQFLMREVYRFRSLIISGAFDGVLIKPMSPLFRSLFGGADILDAVTFIPLLAFLVYVVTKIGDITLGGSILYTLLVINGVIITAAFHILVIGLGILTTTVDNAIWLFRYLLYFGRIPVDVYKEPMRTFLTYLLPVAAMVTIPTQALLGILSWQGILIACLFSGGMLFGSYRFWQFALKRYTSASS